MRCWGLSGLSFQAGGFKVKEWCCGAPIEVLVIVKIMPACACFCPTYKLSMCLLCQLSSIGLEGHESGISQMESVILETAHLFHTAGWFQTTVSSDNASWLQPLLILKNQQQARFCLNTDTNDFPPFGCLIMRHVI